MTSIFLAYDEICLDESMSIWHIIWTFPVWILCPRKPHPFGSEWHNSCCAFPGILFVVELVEGKEHPLQDGPLEFEDLGRKTVELLLRKMKSSFATGRYVILDSGFCILKGLIHLRNKGVVACAFINKRRYWTSMVPGKYMEDNFREVEVGETDAIQVTVDDVIYNLWGIKEPTYVMRIMANGDRLLVHETCNEIVIRLKENGEDVVKKFNYKLPYDWNFCYRHVVDDHNKLRHSMPSFDHT